MDGTIVDSAVAITSRISDTLQEFGCEPPEPSELRHLIGPPTRTMLAEFIEPDQLDRALTFYKALAVREGSAHTALFPGMADALGVLAGAGIPLALATSKPQDEAVRLTHEFGIADSLSAIVGAAPERPTKADVVREGLRQLETTSSHAPILVGDRLWDIEGANANGIPTLLVRWGYAREEEFMQAFAVVDTVGDLVTYVSNGELSNGQP